MPPGTPTAICSGAKFAERAGISFVTHVSIKRSHASAIWMGRMPGPSPFSNVINTAEDCPLRMSFPMSLENNLLTMKVVASSPCGVDAIFFKRAGDQPVTPAADLLRAFTAHFTCSVVNSGAVSSSVGTRSVCWMLESDNKSFSTASLTPWSPKATRLAGLSRRVAAFPIFPSL